MKQHNSCTFELNYTLNVSTALDSILAIKTIRFQKNRSNAIVSFNKHNLLILNALIV